MADEILIGWDSIRSCCGTVCVRTMKNIVKKYHIRIRWINGKPAIKKVDLIKWFDTLPDKKAKGRIFP